MIYEFGDLHIVLNQVIVAQALCEFFMALLAHVLVNNCTIGYDSSSWNRVYGQLFGFSLLA